MDNGEHMNGLCFDVVAYPVWKPLRKRPTNVLPPITNSEQEGLTRQVVNRCAYFKGKLRTQCFMLVFIPSSRLRDVGNGSRQDIQSEPHFLRLDWIRVFASSQGTKLDGLRSH